jgi:isocitrate dehydrogenase
MSPPWADDFRSNEQSVIMPADDTLTIAHRHRRHGHRPQGRLKVLAGEVVDATFMSAPALDAFLAEQVARAKAEDVLFSVHLKATMMKVSDPIIFGHVVRAFFADVFAAHGEALAAGLDPEQRPRPRSSTGSTARERRRDQGRLRAGIADGPRWRWSTPTRASPTCTCPATSSSTPRCPP